MHQTPALLVPEYYHLQEGSWIGILVPIEPQRCTNGTSETAQV